jgi:hypothetical protein
MLGTKLVCKTVDCNEVLDYMTAPTGERGQVICPECGHDEFRRLDEPGRQGPWETSD